MTTVKSIFFHGKLQETYGKEPVRLAVSNGLQMWGSLCTVFPDFQDDCLALKDLHFLTKRDQDVDSIELPFIQSPLDGVDEIHIVPHVAGAGVEIAVTYLALSGLAAIAVGTLINIAIGLVVGSIVASLSAKPTAGASEVDKPSYIFNGPMLMTDEGLPVPKLYGRFPANGYVISQGISSKEIGLDE